MNGGGTFALIVGVIVALAVRGLHEIGVAWAYRAKRGKPNE